MSRKTSSNAIRTYFVASLRADALLEAQLILLTFSTGIQDAISFPDYHCFASNQTGNTVVFAVGAAGFGSDLFSLSNVGMSLGMFLAGSIITGQLANLVGPRRRLWLLATHSAQTTMAIAAAVIQSTFSTSTTTNSLTLVPIALLAFSSGAQVASMRPFRIQEITTAMATAAWVDLVVDPKLLAANNRSRNRRAVFLIALVVGSFAGAFMHKGIGSANALLIAAMGKLVVLFMLLLNKAAPSAVDDPSILRA